MGTSFALMGAAGYIAPRHMNAIHEVGGDLVAATDIHDSVGILDKYFSNARFFTEIERFDRHLEKMRREGSGVDYVSICSPNYLHDAHVRLALRVHANAICEKPLVVNPWNIDQLQEIENELPGRIYNVLQLRLHPNVKALKEKLDAETNEKRHDVVLSYVSRRGKWYHSSWKGDSHKSGGVAMNIGIHFFDLMLWLFGGCQRNMVHLTAPSRMAGVLELERARVRWFLSVDDSDLPKSVREAGGYSYRNLEIDGESLDLTPGFTDLHTAVYQDILSGGGFGLQDARPSIELVHSVRHSLETQGGSDSLHPRLTTEKW